MTKSPNHLAALIDHQSAAKNTLPKDLTKTLTRFTQATQEVKAILLDCLPEEIIQSCQVVGLSEDSLTLSLPSQTAANHIRYLQSDYVKLLKEGSTTFASLRQIRLVVVPPILAKIEAKNATHPYKNKGLSETTRQTIAHVAHHVITDENLKKSLLKLAKEA